MRGSSGWTAGALALLLAGSSAIPLGAQDSGSDEDRCACVDPDRIREEVREGVEQARDEVEHAREHARREIKRARDELREQAREIRVRMDGRARLGVGIAYDQDERWDSLGVRVTEVPDDGPAADAGIRRGDVLVALDGQRLTAPLDEEVEDELRDEGSRPVQRLVALLRRHEPGDEVEVTFLREGRRTTTTVELGRRRGMRRPAGPPAPEAPHVFHFRGSPGAQTPRPPRPRPEVRREMRRGRAPLRWTEECRELAGEEGPAAGRGCVAGLRVTGLGPELGEYFGTEDGVLVIRVADGSVLGLEPGDVVLGIGGREVEDPGDLRRILRSYEEDEEVRLRIRRSGEEREITGTMP